jgi:predicted DNA-binding transcriptional regulator YafY
VTSSLFVERILKDFIINNEDIFMKIEASTKETLLRLLRIYMEQPFVYTRKELSQKLGIDIQTVTSHNDALTIMDFEVIFDSKTFRYGLKDDKVYDQLKNLLHFTETEQEFLSKAIANYDKYKEFDRTTKQIKKKLASLYDYHKLGLEVLRKPHLQKINMLEKAKNEQYRIYLIDYFSSNSNSIKDRLVEPLQVSPMDDMLYAYDVDNDKISHFRLSRISRIKTTNEPFIYKKAFHIGSVDPFYIVSEENEKEFVHLKFGVRSYNEIVTRFPLTKNHIRPDAEQENLFDFQCYVNDKFFGITNFIFNVFHDKYLQVLEPPELVEHLEKNLEKMLHKFRVDV